MDMEKASVPKFGSYRPKQISSAGSEAQSFISEPSHLNSSHALSEFSHEHRSHDKLQNVRGPKRENRKSRNDVSRHEAERREAAADSKTTVSQWQAQDSQFFIDQRGDLGNVEYGSINKYEVPTYRPYKDSSLLGAPNEFFSGRLPTASVLSHMNSAQSRALKIAPKYITTKGPLWNHEDEFVTLKPPKRANLELNDGGESNLTNEATLQGYLARASSVSSLSSQDSENEDNGANGKGISNSADLKDVQMTNLRQRNQELSNKVQQGGSRAWLDFIDFQEIWLRHGYYQDSYRSLREEERSIANVKLSMYEKAIKESTKSKDGDRERLLIGMMETAEKALDFVKLASKWEELMRAEGQDDYILLWSAYLTFVQTTMGEFSYDRCQDVIKQYLSFLDRKAPRYTAEFTVSQFSLERIHLTLRAALFLRETGYLEFSTAIWQALLELNLFYPKNFRDTGVPQLLKEFEDFWESEWPRVGEERSKGWRCATPDALDEQTNYADDPFGQPKLRDFAEWEFEESRKEIQSKRPGRSTDDAALEDPYRAVLFSDVELFLFQSSEASIEDLVDALLMFLGLPPVQNAGLSNTIWRHNGLLASRFHFELDGRAITSLHLLSNVEQFQTSNQTLFCHGDHPFRSFGVSNDDDYSTSRQRDLSFERNVLSQLVSIMPEYIELTEYYLAFELSLEPIVARKKAKAFVKSMPSRLRLYNAYALVEARSGNHDAADRVFSTAISMSIALPLSEQEDVIMLWKSWIWEAMYSNNPRLALGRLVQVGKAVNVMSEKAPAPTAEDVSQAHGHLSDHLAAATIGKRENHSIHYIELLALLAYFTAKSDLSAALELYSSFSALRTASIDNAPDPHLELLHQSQAHLIAHHTQLLSRSDTRTPQLYAPSVVRTALTESIRLFPNNTIFLTLYAANEARFRIDDRVRHIMRTATLASPATQPDAPLVSAWAFAVRAEMMRGVNLGSTPHAVRAAFERAVGSKHGRGCSTLWAAFVLFEMERWEADTGAGRGAEDGAKRVREVFFRGLRHLPGVKPFYMMAFRRLGAIFEESDLRKVYDVMAEKGLRVHVDYDEWVKSGQ